MKLVLASQSSERLLLLKSIGVCPNNVISTDIDESPLTKELPIQLAQRLSKEKSNKALSLIEEGYIITADTVPALGRRAISKALTDDDVRFMLKLFSGRRHKVYTAIDIVKKRNGEIRRLSRIVTSIVKIKRLTEEEIEMYVSSGEGIGKAGGYAIKGLIQRFIEFLSGSTSNIGGIPLRETYNMLTSLGYFNGRTF